MKNENNIYSFDFEKVLTVIFLLGGIGSLIWPTIALYVFIALLFLFGFVKFKQISLPPKFNYFLVFMFLLLVSCAWSKNVYYSLILFIYFLSGTFFWIFGYNFANSRIFLKIILTVGVVFGVFGILSLGLPDIYNPLSLIFYAVEPRHHHHVADFWLIVMLILALNPGKWKKSIMIPLTMFGFAILTISLSRSAYMGLGITSLFLVTFSKVKIGRNSRILLHLYVVISVLLFILASAQKSTIIAHYSYYEIGILSSLKNPIGIGIGNFGLVSQSFFRERYDDVIGVGNAHNLILEVTTGMGFLGISFLIWLFLVFKLLFRSTSSKNLVWTSVFLAIFVNFMTDYTYLIPSMFWIWFLVLGIAQRFRQS